MIRICSIQFKITINMQQIWLLLAALLWETCYQSEPHDVFCALQSCGKLIPICINFLHINIFSIIWQNSTWTARAPEAWMTNYHTHPPSYVYRYSTELGRIGTWIALKSMHKVSLSIFKYEKSMMLQWSTHWFIKIYHAGMCSIWIERLWIPRQPKFLISLIHYLNIIVQYNRLTVHVRYANQVMSPHIQKLKIQMRVLW